MKKHLANQYASNLIEHSRVSHLWIVDWEKYKKQGLAPDSEGGCKAYTYPPTLRDNKTEAATVEITFTKEFDITSLGLKRHAWGKNSVGQCDAILYPTQDRQDDAILLVETKYSDSIEQVKSYINKACKQITDTVEQLTEISCPLTQRNLYGLIGFPKLIIGSAVLISPATLGQLYRDYHLEVMVGNYVNFDDEYTITPSTTTYK